MDFLKLVNAKNEDRKWRREQVLESWVWFFIFLLLFWFKDVVGFIFDLYFCRILFSFLLSAKMEEKMGKK